ncbi:MAG: right-handed parallel beta-helix repeat-containing protein [Promethearchaeota archaeon]
MKKQIIIRCLVVLFLFNIYAISLGFDSFRIPNLTENNNFQIKFGIIHSPINISGNTEFTAPNGVSSGAGTSGDPYIIRDLIIEVAGSQSCILISNTNVFFKIENCTLKTLGLYTINLINVSNGWIHNNDISLAGISLFNSHNNNISNNILLDYNEIYIGFSDNNNILNNYIKNSTTSGIKFISSNDNIVEGNEIYDCSDFAIGIWSASNNSIIRNNYIFNNGDNIGEDQIDIDGDCNGTILSGNVYGYRDGNGGLPWLLILIIILIVSAAVATIALLIFLYRRHRKVKEKHPEPPEPLDTSDLW